MAKGRRKKSCEPRKRRGSTITLKGQRRIVQVAGVGEIEIENVTGERRGGHLEIFVGPVSQDNEKQ
jgi:hypothetical protein